MATYAAVPLTRGLRIGMVAGEASGDLLAARLMEALNHRSSGLSAFGIGGPQMQRAGFDAWWPSHKLSVFGYLDALRHLPELLYVRRQVGNRLLGAQRPDLFVGIDAPDFNFGLETRLRAGGVKTAHFVCPSIWAWRAKRVQVLAAAADHVLCLFPFEPELLASHGIAASFVGHPLADEIPLEVPRLVARQALNCPAQAQMLALLPGSRRSELQHIAPAMLRAAALLARERPGMQFVLPVAPGMGPVLAPMLPAYAPGVAIQCLEGRAAVALAACDATLIASGTATLEAALYKRPMVITYRMNTLNYRAMRGKALLPWFGLPNVLSGEFVVPELIQDAATPEAMAEATLAWLDQPARCAALEQRFLALHQTLRQNTAQKAVDAITKMLGQ